MPSSTDQPAGGRRSGIPDKRARARQRITEKRAAEAAAAAARARKRRAVVAAVSAAVVVVVVVVVVVAVQTARTSATADAAAPANVSDGAFTVGDGGPVVVQVYEDFLCPVCGQFEASTGDTLEQLAADGSIELRYQPIAILDYLSPDDYSTRALNAAAVVADAAGVQAFQTMHDALYAQQPAENALGLTDDQLVAMAADAGAPGADVEAAIRDLRFQGWTARVTDRASQDGVTGTPTVLVDGEPLTDRSPAGLTAAVQAAQGD